MDKPTVLILGGCGFIGRNLVSYIISNHLASNVRIVDKVPPQVAWLTPKHQEYFNNHLVEFKSANLINSESCTNAFAPLDGKPNWDFVINCAGETKPGQTDPVFKEGILKLSVNCAKNAALQKVKRYVEISSGQMYSSEKVPHKENGAVQPWSYVGRWKRQVEEELMKMNDLKFTILRPGVVYGPGDRTAITHRIIIAAIYKYMGETMKLLWNTDLLLNTVHVDDLSRAIWFVCNRDDTAGQIYNVVDDGTSTQGSISDQLGELFNIKIEYYGNMVSSVVDLASAADDANDKHLAPWAEACHKSGIDNTPLSPHMDPELLLHKHVNLDGNKLKDLGFDLTVPKITPNKLTEIIQDFIVMKVFPHTLAP